MDILEYLSKHRMEVKNMILTEFDEQKYTDMIRAEGKAEGLAEMLVKAVELFSSKHNVDISTACEELGYTRKDYDESKKILG